LPNNNERCYSNFSPAFREVNTHQTIRNSEEYVASTTCSTPLLLENACEVHPKIYGWKRHSPCSVGNATETAAVSVWTRSNHHHSPRKSYLIPGQGVAPSPRWWISLVALSPCLLSLLCPCPSDHPHLPVSTGAVTATTTRSKGGSRNSWRPFQHGTPKALRRQARSSGPLTAAAPRRQPCPTPMPCMHQCTTPGDMG
jgi:hypothetical protein